MLKFVLIFMAVSITGAQDLCTIENRVPCYDHLRRMRILNADKDIVCSFVANAEICLNRLGCDPKKNNEYMAAVKAACDSDCDVVQLFKCTREFYKTINKERTNICNADEQELKNCYARHKCDVVFDKVAKRIQRICSTSEGKQ